MKSDLISWAGFVSFLLLMSWAFHYSCNGAERPVYIPPDTPHTEIRDTSVVTDGPKQGILYNHNEGTVEVFSENDAFSDIRINAVWYADSLFLDIAALNDSTTRVITFGGRTYVRK